MSPQERHRVAGAERGDYRRLLAALASRARRLGSHDPESAAQEALKRSIEDARSRPAVEFYLSDGAADVHQPSPWPLDQLLAWLHAVLRNIIREERGRAGFKREMPDDGDGFPASGPDVLARLIEEEGQRIFRDCFENLSVDYRTVLTLRARGLKYSEIAGRMGINENTVATWISRATRRLGELARLRTVRHTV